MAVAKLIAELERPCERPLSLAGLLRRCREDPALRRVVERVYEIVAYAVIDTLIERSTSKSQCRCQPSDWRCWPR